VDAMAKDGEVAPLVQPLLRRHRYEVADAMIKAQIASKLILGKDMVHRILNNLL
jgi:hypothetical protein